MSGETIVTIVGTVGQDPELRFTPSGAAVAKFSVAVTSRRKNQQTDEWEDKNTSWYSVNAWRLMAENVAESITQGMRVVVIGRQEYREYETKDGEKRKILEIEADEVAPSLKWATAKVTKITRQGGSSGGTDNDPWASASPAAGSGTGGWNTGGQTDEPPF